MARKKSDYYREPLEAIDAQNEARDYADISSNNQFAINAPKYESTYAGNAIGELVHVADTRQEAYYKNKEYMAEIQRGVSKMDLHKKDAGLYAKIYGEIDNTVSSILQSGNYEKAGAKVSDLATSIITNPKYNAAVKDAATIKQEAEINKKRYLDNEISLNKFLAKQQDLENYSSVESRYDPNLNFVMPEKTDDYAKEFNFEAALNNYHQQWGTHTETSQNEVAIFDDLAAVNQNSMPAQEFYKKYNMTAETANTWGIAKAFNMSSNTTKYFDGRNKEQGIETVTYNGKVIDNKELQTLTGAERFAAQGLLQDSAAMADLESEAKALNKLNGTNLTAGDLLFQVVKGKNKDWQESSSTSSTRLNDNFATVMQKAHENAQASIDTSKLSKIDLDISPSNVSPEGAERLITSMNNNVATLQTNLDNLVTKLGANYKEDPMYLSVRAELDMAQAGRFGILRTYLESGKVDKNSTIYKIISTGIKNNLTEQQIEEQITQSVDRQIKAKSSDVGYSKLTDSDIKIGTFTAPKNAKEYARTVLQELYDDAADYAGDGNLSLGNMVEDIDISELSPDESTYIDGRVETGKNILESFAENEPSMINMEGTTIKKWKEDNGIAKTEHNLVRINGKMYLEISGTGTQRSTGTAVKKSDYFLLPESAIGKLGRQFVTKAELRNQTETADRFRDMFGMAIYSDDFQGAVTNNLMNSESIDPAIRNKHTSYKVASTVNNRVYNTYSFTGSQYPSNNTKEQTVETKYKVKGVMIPNVNPNSISEENMLLSGLSVEGNKKLATELNGLASELDKLIAADPYGNNKLTVEIQSRYDKLSYEAKWYLNSINGGAKDEKDFNPFQEYDDYNGFTNRLGILNTNNYQLLK